MLAAIAICLVVGISDGDTLTARCGQPGSYQELKVRLSAIDAPEKGQPFGQRSKQALSDLCYRRQASLRTVSTDRYGRTVADVECGGRDVATEMVRAGSAWVYDQYAKGYPQLYPLQASARAARRGLWAEARPAAPRDFRQGGASASPPDAHGCITGPRGGRYTLDAGGKKHYGC